MSDHGDPNDQAIPTAGGTAPVSAAQPDTDDAARDEAPTVVTAVAGTPVTPAAQAPAEKRPYGEKLREDAVAQTTALREQAVAQARELGERLRK